MSAAQLPRPRSAVGLTAPHALQALFSLTAEAHGCLKSLLSELKPSVALLTGRDPRLKGDVCEKGGIPQSELAWSAVPWERGEAFKRALASRYCRDEVSQLNTSPRRGSCAGAELQPRSPSADAVLLCKPSWFLQEASADWPDLRGGCERNPLGQTQIKRNQKYG